MIKVVNFEGAFVNLPRGKRRQNRDAREMTEKGGWQRRKRIEIPRRRSGGIVELPWLLLQLNFYGWVLSRFSFAYLIFLGGEFKKMNRSNDFFFSFEYWINIRQFLERCR